MQFVEPEELVLPADATPLDFLCAVYRDATQPLGTRLKAAIAAAPYCHPKLAITANVATDMTVELEQRLAQRLAHHATGSASPTEPPALPASAHQAGKLTRRF